MNCVDGECVGGAGGGGVRRSPSALCTEALHTSYSNHTIFEVFEVD